MASSSYDAVIRAGHIMYFSSMNYGTLSDLYRMEGNMDWYMYAEIVRNSLMTS